MGVSLVSVVIPSYNRAVVLPQALESALAQSYRDLEVIVVDDGSTDTTADFLLTIRDPRVRVIRNTRNVGAAESRNIGVREAKGEFIAFLDSDDTWLPEKLSSQIAALHGTPQETLCVSGVFLHRADGSYYPRKPQKVKSSWLLSFLAGQNFCPGTSLLMRRSTFLEIGPLMPLARLEDVDWLLRYFLKYDAVVIVPEPLAHIYPSGTATIEAVCESVAQLTASHNPAMRARGREVARAFTMWASIERLATYYRHSAYGYMMKEILMTSIRHPFYLALLMQRALRRYRNLKNRSAR